MPIRDVRAADLATLPRNFFRRDNVSALPPITLSSTDRDRLYALLDADTGDTEIIDNLYHELERATVVPDAALPDDVVAVNTQVTFINEQSGKTHQVKLVWPRDHHGAETVSVLAPAGAALLGLRVGDHIAWPSEGKTLRLKLVAVANNGQAAAE